MASKMGSGNQPNMNENNTDTDKTLRHQDGGWGWVVVIATFTISALTDGVTFSFGILFIELVSQFGKGKAETAWIGSLVTCTIHIFGPVNSVAINRYGWRKMCITGAFISFLGLSSSFFCTEIYQLYITFGIGAGYGFGLMYLAANVCVIRHFDKRRALASGIASCGSGVGSFLFNPLTNWLINLYGWRGTVLIEGALLFNGVVCGALLRPLDDADQKQKQRKYKKDRQNKYGTNSGSLVVINAECSVQLLNKHSSPQISTTSEQSGTTPTTDDVDNVDFHKTCKTLESSEITLVHHDICDMDVHQRKDGAFRDASKGCKEYSTPEGDRVDKVLIKFKSSPEKLDDVAESENTHASTKGYRSCLSLINWHLLKQPLCMLYLISGFFINLGFTVPFSLLPDWAVEKGFSKDLAVWLLSALAICNTVSRCILGWLSDKRFVNRIILFRVILLLLGLITMLSPLCKPYWLMMVYACVFGTLIGGFVMLCPVVLADTFGAHLIADMYGLYFLFLGIGGLVSTPIGGWIFDTTGSYNVSFIVAGMEFFIGGLILYIPDIVKYCTGSDASYLQPVKS